MESRTIDLDGPVHYADFGGAGPPLLLVHGLGGSHLNWAAVAPALARRHRVVALDLPGFGRTPRAGRATGLLDNAHLVNGFIDAVLGGRATLVGNSMGGLVSMIVAAEMPDRVSALVLVNAPYPPVFGVLPDAKVTLIFGTYVVPWVGPLVTRARLTHMSPERIVRETLDLCCPRPDALDRALVDAHVALERERRAIDGAPTALLDAARSLLFALATPGRVRALAQRVQAPALVVHGDRDRLVPLRAALVLARRQGWDVEVFNGVGHVPQLEAPARFVEVVERWLDRIAAGL